MNATASPALAGTRRRLVRRPPQAGPATLPQRPPLGPPRPTQAAPETPVISDSDLVCRAPHPGVKKGKDFYRGRIHGNAFKVGLPEGFTVRFVEVLEEKQKDTAPIGMLRLQCDHSDCKHVSVFQLIDNRGTPLSAIVAVAQSG